MVVIWAAVWYNKGVKIKAYQGFPGFQPGLFSCSPVPLLRHIGLNGVQEAAGSNPVTRTILCGHLGEQGGLRNTPDLSGVFLIFSLIYWLEKHFDRSKLHQYFEETNSSYIF